MDNKIKLGLVGFLTASSLALLSGRSDDNLVSKERINGLKWISEYKNGERRIVDNRVHEIATFIDENGDNKIDEYRVLGASRVSLTYMYELKGAALGSHNFDKEEGIFREHQLRKLGHGITEKQGI